MNNNQDVQEIHDGKLVDMRIETIMSAILAAAWDVADFDTLFNELVREFVNSDVPPFKASKAGAADHADSYTVAAYLALLRFEYVVTYPGADQWPGTFDFMPSARFAISIFYPNNSDESTQYVPGNTFNQAALLAVMQYARERSAVIYNQTELRLN